MANNTFCHIEFQVTDLGRAQKFYGDLFEWKFRAFGDEMVVFGAGDDHLGGLTKVDTVASGLSPSVWIEADNIEKYLSAAVAAGGAVHSQKSEVPHVGWSAVILDPDGNHVGLVQFSSK